MSKKLKMFDYDDPDLGNVKVKGKSSGDDIQVKIGSGQWKDVSEYAGSDPVPPNPNAEFGFFRGSRWVYINGKWYKIG